MADDDNAVWAEYGDTLRLPIDADSDYISAIPWERAALIGDRPLIDIGCGSGLTTLALAARFPLAEILAVEPDPLMRSLLMLRVAERPEIRSRTTVLPESILDVWLPDECGGALLFNVIYFLGGRTRDRFWTRMAQVLVPGAPILMSRSYGGVPDTLVERHLAGSATMGRHEYQRFFEAKPAGEGRVEIVNTYIVLRDGEQVRTARTVVTPLSLDEEVILSEIPIGKFSIEEIDENYIAVRRQPDLRR
ncbi:class I SAM-dependent methyltransferase [Dermatophilaceae bacterium Sec6.4]